MGRLQEATLEPAYSIVMAIGSVLPGSPELAYDRGARHIAALCGVTPRHVRRWAAASGTGGLVPHWHQRAILEEATRIGAQITANSFFPTGGKARGGRKASASAA